MAASATTHFTPYSNSHIYNPFHDPQITAHSRQVNQWIYLSQSSHRPQRFCFFLFYLSQQYSQSVVLVANVSVIRSIFVNGKWHLPEGWRGLSNRGLAGAKLEERRLVRFDKRSSSRPLCLCGSRSEIRDQGLWIRSRNEAPQWNPLRSSLNEFHGVNKGAKDTKILLFTWSGWPIR